jgi:hypothetical protein
MRLFTKDLLFLLVKGKSFGISSPFCILRIQDNLLRIFLSYPKRRDGREGMIEQVVLGGRE